MEISSSSCVMPVMISGITSGALTMAVSVNRPRKRLKRTSAIAASVPSTMAEVAATKPMRSDSQAAEMS